MTALVERGAPRDFRDIFTLCQAGLTEPGRCWFLWKERQRLSRSDSDSQRARLAVQTHLARIAVYRPLDHIDDPGERQAAQQLRDWFYKDFLDALMD